MAVNWDTFERYRQKGLDARRAGQWDSARIYLLEAARAMVELSKQAQGDELQEGRRQMARVLIGTPKSLPEISRLLGKDLAGRKLGDEGHLLSARADPPTVLVTANTSLAVHYGVSSAKGLNPSTLRPITDFPSGRASIFPIVKAPFPPPPAALAIPDPLAHGLKAAANSSSSTSPRER